MSSSPITIDESLKPQQFSNDNEKQQSSDLSLPTENTTATTKDEQSIGSPDESQQQQQRTSSTSPPQAAVETSSAAVKAIPVSTSIKAETLPAKVTVTLKAVGDAPILKQKNWAIEPSKSMAYVNNFLRQILKLSADQSLFVFVNQCFAPSAEHTIGTLTQCFGNLEGGKLVLHYSTTQAWG